MPLYEYECPGCGQTFEKLTKSSEADAPKPCPNCGNTHARRMPSTFAFRGGSRGSGGGVAAAPAPVSL